MNTKKCAQQCEIPPCILNQSRGHGSAIRALRFHPNMEAMFSGNGDGSITSWNYRDLDPRTYRFKGHTGAINDVGISSSGELMISASNDSTVRIWVPVATGEVMIIKAHSTAVRSACFNPTDSSVFATCSTDKTIKIWSTQKFRSSKKEMKSYDFLHSFREHRNWVHSVRFSPDGSLLCSASDDKTVKIFDMRQKRCAISINNPLGRSLHAEFNPCGNSYIGVSTDQSSFILFDVRTKSISQLYPSLFAAPVNHFAFHPSGDFVVCVSDDGKIKVLDLNEAHPIFTLYAAREALYATAFSSDGSLFATGGSDKEILLWGHSMTPYKVEVKEIDGGVEDLEKELEKLSTGPSRETTFEELSVELGKETDMPTKNPFRGKEYEGEADDLDENFERPSKSPYRLKEFEGEDEFPYKVIGKLSSNHYQVSGEAKYPDNKEFAGDDDYLYKVIGKLSSHQYHVSGFDDKEFAGEAEYPYKVIGKLSSNQYHVSGFDNKEFAGETDYPYKVIGKLSGNQYHVSGSENKEFEGEDFDQNFGREIAGRSSKNMYKELEGETEYMDNKIGGWLEEPFTYKFDGFQGEGEYSDKEIENLSNNLYAIKEFEGESADSYQEREIGQRGFVNRYQPQKLERTSRESYKEAVQNSMDLIREILQEYDSDSQFDFNFDASDEVLEGEGRD